jgi:hypothetical protein
MNVEYIKEILLAIYFGIILWTFITSAYHFIGWFHNSVPPKNIFGQIFEVYTMFFDCYLTKEGIEHKYKFLRWFFVTILMAIVWIIPPILLKILS